MRGQTYSVTPDTWKGARDRSWGVRPVGEAEAPGIRLKDFMQGTHGFFHQWLPMQFDDFVDQGAVRRAVRRHPHPRRVGQGAQPRRRPPDEHMGRPEIDITYIPGTREIERAVLTLTRHDGETRTVTSTPLRTLYLKAGTGYMPHEGWGHGFYQGRAQGRGPGRSTSARPKRAPSGRGSTRRWPASSSTPAKSGTACTRTWSSGRTCRTGSTRSTPSRRSMTRRSAPRGGPASLHRGRDGSRRGRRAGFCCPGIAADVPCGSAVGCRVASRSVAAGIGGGIGIAVHGEGRRSADDPRRRDAAPGCGPRVGGAGERDRRSPAACTDGRGWASWSRWSSSRISCCPRWGSRSRPRTCPAPTLGDATPADYGLDYRDVTFPATRRRGAVGLVRAVDNGDAVDVVARRGFDSVGGARARRRAGRVGYGVLLFDARGHGDSDGRAMDFGWYGDRDIAGAVEFVAQQPDVGERSHPRGRHVDGWRGGDRRGWRPTRGCAAVVAEGATVESAADRGWLSNAYGRPRLGARGTRSAGSVRARRPVHATRRRRLAAATRCEEMAPRQRAA